jgi:hypothetical protein
MNSNGSMSGGEGGGGEAKNMPVAPVGVANREMAIRCTKVQQVESIRSGLEATDIERLGWPKTPMHSTCNEMLVSSNPSKARYSDTSRRAATDVTAAKQRKEVG